MLVGSICFVLALQNPIITPKGQTPPKDSARIVKTAPPVYADAATRKLVEGCRKAYAALKSGKFSITIDGRSKQYAFSGGRLYGAQEGVKWSFADKQLTVAKGQNFYKGKVRPYGINQYLVKAGASPEMLPIQLLDKKNPMAVVIPPGARVKKIGSGTTGHTPFDIVEATSGGIVVSISIRRDNHLLAALGAKNLDSRGRTVSRTWRDFSWSGINAALPANQFQLSGAKSPQPLKSIK